MESERHRDYIKQVNFEEVESSRKLWRYGEGLGRYLSWCTGLHTGMMFRSREVSSLINTKRHKKTISPWVGQILRKLHGLRRAGG